MDLPTRDSETAELLRQFLERQDVACPACGYNLRGLLTNRCPECAGIVVLGVGPEQPRMAAFIAGLLGLASGTGFSGLLLIYAIVMVWVRGRGGIQTSFLLVTAAGLAIEGALLLVWLYRGAKIRQSNSQWRWYLAVSCWLLSLINLAVFVALIR